ncbi:DUF6092 family protein [Saccharothrix deserti]|uniref:DUF6092 family protein n=1 Tax=Saccharothrix deserti TaxID=2593674 RepID=UPI001EE43465|nr:DUF6092 family protein [Saccharothrix deserti]
MNPGNDSTHVPLEEGIFLLACYLLSSARGLLDEPPEYSPSRCMDGARRALQLLEEHWAEDPRLSAVRAQVEELLYAPMNPSDPVELASTLDALCGDLAEVCSAPDCPITFQSRSTPADSSP